MPSRVPAIPQMPYTRRYAQHSGVADGTVGRVSRAAGQSEEEEIPGQLEVFCYTFMDLREIVLTVQRSVRVERA